MAEQNCFVLKLQVVLQPLAHPITAFLSKQNDLQHIDKELTVNTDCALRVYTTHWFNQSARSNGGFSGNQVINAWVKKP